MRAPPPCCAPAAWPHPPCGTGPAGMPTGKRSMPQSERDMDGVDGLSMDGRAAGVPRHTAVARPNAMPAARPNASAAQDQSTGSAQGAPACVLFACMHAHMQTGVCGFDGHVVPTCKRSAICRSRATCAACAPLCGAGQRCAAHSSGTVGSVPRAPTTAACSAKRMHAQINHDRLRCCCMAAQRPRRRPTLQLPAVMLAMSLPAPCSESQGPSLAVHLPNRAAGDWHACHGKHGVSMHTRLCR